MNYYSYTYFMHDNGGVLLPVDQGGVHQINLVHDHHHGDGATLSLHLLLPPGNFLKRFSVCGRECKQTKI